MPVHLLAPAAMPQDAPAPGAPIGPWLTCRVSDAGTPLGTGFVIGAQVFVRDAGEGIHHLLRLLPAGGAMRRRLTQQQRQDFTRGDYAEAPDQNKLNAAWTALEPRHAGFLQGQVPRYYKGQRVMLRPTTPAVKEKDWQADWDAAEPVIYLEPRVFARPPIPQPEETDAVDIALTLEHEAHEKLATAELVDAAHPFISPADRARLLVEDEGLGHAATIGPVDGYWGADAEQRYYLADKHLMERRGFAKEVKNWPDGATI